MKTNRIILILTLVVSVFGFNGCSPEDDIQNPNFQPLIMNEDFNRGFNDDNTLTVPGWLNYSETGTRKWRYQEYQHNAYAEFSSFQTNEAVNVGWLISPAIDLDKQKGEKLTFDVAQSYVTSSANSLEVFISTDFDGTNVTAATWQPVSANLPTTASVYFKFQSSGKIDLSGFEGKGYIAFKVKGSGTNNALDGAYQIDNVKVFN